MKRLFSTLLLTLSTVGILRGQEAPKTEDAAPPISSSYLAIEKNSAGENLLVVKYPWQTHEKPSIEVRLVTDEDNFDARLRPLRFSQIRFVSDDERRIYSSLDNALDHPSEWKADAGGFKWNILGHANHLGRPAQWFIHAPDKESELFGNTAAFFPLDPWVVNDRLLMLDLPRKYFSQSGKLTVWFLRGERIIWQESITWPGQKVTAEE